MQRPPGTLLGLATGAHATRRSLRGGPGHRGAPSDHFDGELVHTLETGETLRQPRPPT